MEKLFIYCSAKRKSREANTVRYVFLFALNRRAASASASERGVPKLLAELSWRLCGSNERPCSSGCDSICLGAAVR